MGGLIVDRHSFPEAVTPYVWVRGPARALDDTNGMLPNCNASAQIEMDKKRLRK